MKKERKWLSPLSRAIWCSPSDTVLVGIARMYIREGYDWSIVRKRLDFMHDASAVVSIDKEIAVTVSKCYIEMLEKSKELNQPKP